MGLEPIRRATHAPQTCLSANSSTTANSILVTPSFSNECYYITAILICQVKFLKKQSIPCRSTILKVI